MDNFFVFLMPLPLLWRRRRNLLIQTNLAHNHVRVVPSNNPKMYHRSPTSEKVLIIYGLCRPKVSVVGVWMPVDCCVHELLEIIPEMAWWTPTSIVIPPAICSSPLHTQRMPLPWVRPTKCGMRCQGSWPTCLILSWKIIKFNK